MKPFEDENELAIALSAMRPTPPPAFAARLDARVAAGFPPESRPGAPALSRLADRLRAIEPRRIMVPAGALAASVLIVATALVATSENETTMQSDSGRSPDDPAHLSETVQPAPAGGAAAATEQAGAANGGSGSASSGSSGVQFEAAPPVSSSDAVVRAQPSTGPYASRAAHRDVERGAQIVLGAEPEDIRADSAKVFDAVHAADGIVLSSSIRDGEAGQAGADFELLIPSGKVGDALASFSAIAEVRSRHESTQDITAPTVSTGERLQEANARVRSLLSELAAADTGAERAATEAELRAARAQAAILRSRLSTLDRRANFSRVSVRIESGDPSAGESGGGGTWGVGDGLDDAGRILAVGAGVAIVGLAILAPLALLLLLVWLGQRAWVRRARSSALARPGN